MQTAALRHSKRYATFGCTCFAFHVPICTPVVRSDWDEQKDAEKLSKKIDKKYKIVELHLINGKKRTLLTDDQLMLELMEKKSSHTIFGLNYREHIETRAPSGTTGKRRFTLLFKQVDVEAALADMENSLKKEEELDVSNSENGAGPGLCKHLDSLPSKIVTILNVDKHVWVACSDGHVRIYDKEKLTSPEKVVGSVNIHCSCLSLCGNYVWTGSMDGSIRIYKSKGKIMKENLADGAAQITSILPVGRKVWASADTCISIWNRQGTKCEKTCDTKNYICCMLHVGLVWVGTQNGIQRWDPNQYKLVDSPKFPGIPRTTRVLVQASDMEVWSAGDDGSCVYMWNANGQCIKCIVCASAGEILGILPLTFHVWVATSTGISVYDKMTRDFTKVLTEGAENICAINQVKIGEKSYVWTGNTEGQVNTWYAGKELGKVQPMKLLTSKQKQNLTANWQQLTSVISNINVLELLDESQDVYHAIFVLNKIMQNI